MGAELTPKRVLANCANDPYLEVLIPSTAGSTINVVSSLSDPERTAAEKFLVLDFTKPPPETPEEAKRQGEFKRYVKELTRVNFYLAPLNIIAVGHDLLSFSNHGQIAGATLDYLHALNYFTPFAPNHSKEQLRLLLGESYIAGFKDNSNLIIRIEVRPKDGKTLSFEELLTHSAKFRKLIDVLDHYAQLKGYKVVLEPLSAHDILVIKTLGELHRIRPRDHGDEQFVRRSRVLLKDEGEFYGSLRGTRFKSIEQFTRDLFESRPLGSTQPEEHFPRVNHREACLSYLSAINTFLNPATRNHFGRREAQFLLTINDPSKKLLLDENVTRHIYYEKLPSLIAHLKQLAPSADSKNADVEWSDNKEQVGSAINGFIAELKAICDPVTHKDDYSNPSFIEVVSSALSGAYETDLMQFELPSGFHTAQYAVNIGRFVTGENGKRTFQINSELSKKHRKFLQAFFEVHPEALDGERTAWNILLATDRPLTEEDLTPDDAQEFGTTIDDSVTILSGNAQDEIQMVVRSDPNAKGPLSELKHQEKWAQFYLFNHLHNAASAGTAPMLPPFQRHGDVLMREYLHGKICSRIGRHNFSLAVVDGVMNRLGPICASLFVAGSPNLVPLHDLLLHNYEENPTSLTLLPIGLSQTFRPEVGSRGYTEDYLSDAATLFGAHIASWVTAYLYGKHGATLTAVEREQHKKILVNTAVDSFTLSLLGIQDSDIRKHFRLVRRRYTNYSRLNDLSLPEKYDLPRSFTLSEDILDLSETSVRAISKRFHLNVCKLIPVFEMFLSTGSDKPDPAMAEGINVAAYSLKANHAATGRSGIGGRVLTGGVFNCADFLSAEITWLLNLTDVVSWILEISNKDHNEEGRIKSLLNKAFSIDTGVKNFCYAVRSLRPKVHLTHSQAEMFYHAVNELKTAWLNSRVNDPAHAMDLHDAVAAISNGLILLSQPQKRVRRHHSSKDA